MNKSEETRRKKAQYWKEYRKKIKSNPDQYKIHRKHETNRIRKYREKRQNEKSKQRNRELQRDRQKCYREKLKTEGKRFKSKKPKTFENKEEQRKKWREQKRRQRNKKRNGDEIKQNCVVSEPSNEDLKNKNNIEIKCPDIEIIAEKRPSANMHNNEINVPNKKAKTSDIAQISPLDRPCVISVCNASKNSHSSQMDMMDKTQNVCAPRPLNMFYKRKTVNSNDKKSSIVNPNKISTDSGTHQIAEHSGSLAPTVRRSSSTPATIACLNKSPNPEQRQPKIVYNPERLKHLFYPIIDKLWREPIYNDSKNISIPLDLLRIGKRINKCQYKDPWQFCDDMWSMFDNLLSIPYNNTDPRTYQFYSKLVDIFRNEIDGTMQSIGLCCGRKYAFSPQVLCCAGKQLCTIPRDAVYYEFKKCPKTNNLYSQRNISYEKCFRYCEKCFLEIKGDEVTLSDDPTQPVRKLSKDKFTELKNDYLYHEPFVDCCECGRKMHLICVLHLQAFLPNGFVCDTCHTAKGTKREENVYTAKSIPKTELGTYLEEKVMTFLKDRDSDEGNVTIRVLSSKDKVVEVRPRMKARYCDNGNMADTFKYRAKAIFAFQEIDGTDVCFFGMHVQEYGSDCPLPNSRRVYISYLDSVHFFRPHQLRTDVYHEILIGYLEYVKRQGYHWAHIWACPPSEGDDYIFFCHPTEQKIPKPNRLQEWYKKMLDKAVTRECVINYQDILKFTHESNVTSATQIPYFDGDFWSSILEDIIDEMKRGKTKRIRKKKRKCRKYVCDDNEFIKRIIDKMKEHKEAFFVIRLNSETVTHSLFPITDPDPLTTYDLMDGRDAFLEMATEKHNEFSSLRRAKYSTLAMLYEIHNQGRHIVVCACNNCKVHVGTWLQCTVCENFNLCITCYRRENHAHKMYQHGPDLDKEKDIVESPRKLIDALKQSLEHACQCRDANCRLPRCQYLKKVLSHAESCKKMTGCMKCKHLIGLCLYHAKHCTNNRCKVLFCEEYKQKLKEHNRRQQAEMLQRRKAVMQQMNILK